jgi:hypothetical protein
MGSALISFVDNQILVQFHLSSLNGWGKKEINKFRAADGAIFSQLRFVGLLTNASLFKNETKFCLANFSKSHRELIYQGMCKQMQSIS